MPVLMYVLSAFCALAPRELPTGTQLHIRLATTVGSYASKPGAPVKASVIAPVVVDGETVMPAGGKLTGTVKSVKRVGLGLVRESASIELEFNRLTLPDGQAFPISTRVIEVDSAREQVTRKGVIRGVRTTGSLSYRACGYIKTALLWQFHAQVAFWAIKTLVVQVPEPELYYPAGVELTLVSTEPVTLPAPVQLADTRPPLTAEERSDFSGLVAGMPDRAYTAITKRPSDVINTAFIGSQQQVAAAFLAAGWAEARPDSMRVRLRGTKAVAEGSGFLAAPMSPLTVNRKEADMSWQKGLNDVSKRHHVRLWRQPYTWQGEQVWIGAATRDVDFAFLRPGGRFTHRIEENIDREREKIVNDLAFTACVRRADWLQRPGFLKAARNATGDSITTDGRLALIHLNECQKPRLAIESDDDAPLPRHGRGLQRFARREILSMRNDLIRANVYWRTFEGAHSVFIVVRRRYWPTFEFGSLVPLRNSS